MKTFNKYFKLPVKYDFDSRMIVDFNGNIVLKMRGYGNLISQIGSHSETEKKFDEIANEIVELINKS